MLIRFTGSANVQSDNGRPVTKKLIAQLDGAESDDECSNYFDADLADLGIAGGKVKLAHDADAGRFRVISEYTSPVKLTTAQLKRLARQTEGQWSDGIGEGCFDDLADRLGVSIDLAPIGRDEEVQVEQIDDGRTPRRSKTGLAKAAREGDLSAVRRHLDAGADIEGRQQRYTPLHLSVLYGHAEAALELIARGADVDALDPQGQDPLLLAAVSNVMTDADAAMVAKALLEKGAKVHGAKGPEAKPECGEYTPLYMARNRKKTKMAAVLKKAGAKK